MTKWKSIHIGIPIEICLAKQKAKNYVNTNVLTAKINHNPQATWISGGKRGKDVGWGVQLETSWSQRVEHHTKTSGNIYKHNFLVSHKQKMSSDWKASRSTTTLHWKSFIIFGNNLCSLSGFLQLYLGLGVFFFLLLHLLLLFIKKKSLKNMNLGKANFMCC